MADSEQTAATKSTRTFSERAERSLKDADRALKQVEYPSPGQRAMLQLEHARVYAILQLAEDIRLRHSPPGA